MDYLVKNGAPRAIQDIKDDLLSGVFSTAILFSNKTKTFLYITYNITILLLLIIGIKINASGIYFLFIIIGMLHLIWQVTTLKNNNTHT